MKFKLSLKSHEVGTLKHIVLKQINDEGKTLTETNVGYIVGKYADWIHFDEKSD